MVPDGPRWSQMVPDGPRHCLAIGSCLAAWEVIAAGSAATGEVPNLPDLIVKTLQSSWKEASRCYPATHYQLLPLPHRNLVTAAASGSMHRQSPRMTLMLSFATSSWRNIQNWRSCLRVPFSEAKCVSHQNGTYHNRSFKLWLPDRGLLPFASHFSVFLACRRPQHHQHHRLSCGTSAGQTYPPLSENRPCSGSCWPHGWPQIASPGKGQRCVGRHHDQSCGTAGLELATWTASNLGANCKGFIIHSNYNSHKSCVFSQLKQGRSSSTPLIHVSHLIFLKLLSEYSIAAM